MGLHTEALACYDRAIHLAPDFEGANWNKALLLLLMGDYKEGFEQFEWRLRKIDPSYAVDHLKNNTPDVETLIGKTVIIQYEQGLGDVIMFMRYGSLLQQCGVKVIMMMPIELYEIAKTMNTHIKILHLGLDMPEFDVSIPVMSLPILFGTTLNDVPAPIPYLYATEHKQNAWLRKLGDKKRARIGIAVTGSRAHDNDHNRSMNLETIQPIIDLQIDCHLLQKEVRAHDQGFIDINSNIRCHSRYLNDFSDTAALASMMDIVISVDTSVAHLCAAMGIEVWLLLPYTPDWRWMHQRSDTPWYPSVKIYRQTRKGKWNDVVQTVRNDLKNRLQLD